MEDLQDYRVVAHNTATASANKIHDDAVARAYGFGGGLVPGVDVYAYITHPPAEAWGLEWLRRGTLRARFLAPAYEGDELTVAVGEAVDGPEPAVPLEVRKPDGSVCAVADAALPTPASANAGPANAEPRNVEPAEAERAEAPAEPAGAVGPEPAGPGRWPFVAPPDPAAPPPPASPETLAPGTAFAIRPHTFEAGKAGPYLDDVRERLPLYRDEGVAHPAWLLRDANYVLSANVALGPWIHVESVVRHHGLVTDGMVVTTRATVVREWERKGHRFVELDVGIFGDDRLAAHVTHTAIHTPRRAAG